MLARIWEVTRPDRPACVTAEYIRAPWGTLFTEEEARASFVRGQRVRVWRGRRQTGYCLPEGTTLRAVEG